MRGAGNELALGLVCDCMRPSLGKALGLTVVFGLGGVKLFGRKLVLRGFGASADFGAGAGLG